MKKYENLSKLDERVVEAFKSKSVHEFCVWARKELKPLEAAEVLHDAMKGLVYNSSTVKKTKKKKTDVESEAPDK